jgi:hypothetical protein
MADFLPPDVLAEIVARVGRPDWARWDAQVHAAGCCARPVRLTGRIVVADPATGETSLAYTTTAEPDRILLKACGTRRATRCAACADIYRGDARILVLTGLTGGKGTPDSVASRPAVLATLTAPSFGAVHTAGDPPRPCHPAAPGRCPHGRPLGCAVVHPDNSPAVGAPLCSDCYDFEGAVVFNARATELWRRTTIATRRALAGLLAIPVRRLEDHHRLAYVKVVEYQRRGVVHLHALVRCDTVESDSAPVDAAVLETAVRIPAAKAAAPNPHHPARPVVWRPQIDLSAVDVDQRRRAAGYLAKYATKSTDDAGALDHRLRSGDPAALPIPDHLRTMAETAWRLADHPHLAGLNLRHWAHTLGYRGHWLTKSQAWSTTFGALREARHSWQLEQHGHHPDTEDTVRIGDWTYRGIGHATRGDTWLAQNAHTNRQQNRRTAWEER